MNPSQLARGRFLFWSGGLRCGFSSLTVAACGKFYMLPSKAGGEEWAGKLQGPRNQIQFLTHGLGLGLGEASENAYHVRLEQKWWKSFLVGSWSWGDYRSEVGHRGQELQLQPVSEQEAHTLLSLGQTELHFQC